jgi:5-methylcytosine-specific restriction endonuclease McrA
MQKKNREEIPAETAALVLFLSDRTCCLCRIRGKPIQIHHIDENPSNNEQSNLAVVCFDCHRETQIRGGLTESLTHGKSRFIAMTGSD